MSAHRVYETTMDGNKVHLRMDLIGPEWLVQCLDAETREQMVPDTIQENDEDDALRFMLQRLQSQGKSIGSLRQISFANS